MNDKKIVRYFALLDIEDCDKATDLLGSIDHNTDIKDLVDILRLIKVKLANIELRAKMIIERDGAE